MRWLCVSVACLEASYATGLGWSDATGEPSTEALVHGAADATLTAVRAAHACSQPRCAKATPSFPMYDGRPKDWPACLSVRNLTLLGCRPVEAMALIRVARPAWARCSSGAMDESLFSPTESS